MRLCSFLILVLLASCLGLRAQEDFGSNGYHLSDFGDFESKWKLVTVRYRKDLDQMRFVYANDIAWEALQKRSTDYPDGAIFAKIAIETIDDPAFLSSAVPNSVRRYQFMVRDKKKHAATDGWGYALFGSQGIVPGHEDPFQEKACAACHRLVPDRGYVFAQPMNLSKMMRNPFHWVIFETMGREKLPAWVKGFVPKAQKEVRAVTGLLRENAFIGTMGEIRPTLIQEVLRTKKPALLLAKDSDYYSVVFADPKAKKCAADEVAMRARMGKGSMDLTRGTVSEFCVKTKMD